VTEASAAGADVQGWTADAASAVRSFHNAWQIMATNCPGGSHLERGGVARARTMLPVAPFNGVWGVTTDVDPAEVLDAVDEFAAGDLPWNVQLRPGYPAALDDELARRGLTVTAEIPFMVLPDPEPLAAVVAASAASFRRVETFADLDSTMSLLERGFGMPSTLLREMFPMRLLFMASTWIATDGEDVATGLGMISDGWCGVFNVATPDEHRGRGFGSAVTAQTVEAARTDGARGAYLQSSSMGLRVYEKLGFVTVEQWRQWTPAEYGGPD
jgi:GNAT superfamily N-acetyltransferase